MKRLLDELQEDEISFGDARSPCREVNKIVSSDLRDDPVMSNFFNYAIDILGSSVM